MFEKLGKEPSETQCSAIDGTIKEADEVAGEIDDKAVLDAAIVANTQAVEHYAMFRYGTLIAWAEELGYDESFRSKPALERAADTKPITIALRKRVSAKACLPPLMSVVDLLSAASLDRGAAAFSFGPNSPG